MLSIDLFVQYAKSARFLGHGCMRVGSPHHLHPASWSSIVAFHCTVTGPRCGFSGSTS